jgi:hypothetical protein
MIHFVVVAGSPAAIDRLAPRLLPALDVTRLFDAARVEKIGVSTTWAVAAITAADPTCPTRLVTDDDSMIVVNGPALSARGDQDRLADDVLRDFQLAGTAGVARTLGGSYNFVGVSPDHGLCAFADSSGLFPLYWHQEADFAVFSNRSTTASQLGGAQAGWDLRALAWVIGHANLFGEQMPARSARYLPPGYEARADWGESRVTVHRSPVWVWPEPSDDSGRENLTPAEWDEMTDALVNNFRALRSFSGRLRLSLSGGKDSRLCLALAKAAGLQDRMVTITNGVVDSPEVECAAAVAEAAGFPHKQAGAPVTTAEALAASAPFDPDAVWRRLRQHAYRFEAIVCPWDGGSNPLRSTTVNVKGFGGELYRGPGGHAKRFKRDHPTTVAAMADMFVDYHQRHDPLGVLRPAEAMFQAEWLKGWVHSTAEHVQFDLLPEKFYVDYRLGHWNGPLGQSTPWRINVNPLLLPAVARKNLELSLDVQGTERLHFEVMRRAAPELVPVPFLNDTWSRVIAADSQIELPREPFPTAVVASAHTLKSWQWRFLASERKTIARLFQDAARETDMGSICDMRRLRRLARHSDRLEMVVDAKAVYSAVIVALALLEKSEPVLDLPRREPARNDGESAGR